MTEVWQGAFIVAAVNLFFAYLVRPDKRLLDVPDDSKYAVQSKVTYNASRWGTAVFLVVAVGSFVVGCVGGLTSLVA